MIFQIKKCEVQRVTWMKTNSKWMKKKRITEIVKPLLFLLPNPDSDAVWEICRFYVSVLWVWKLKCCLSGVQHNHANKSDSCWSELQIEGSALDEQHEI